MSVKSSIGWCSMTLNPIKGKCKGGCWYCYTFPMYKMGRLSEPIRLELSAFDKLPKSPRKIFLCSTHELFGDWIPKDWRDKIFKKMEDFPQHTFQILTKMPENIDREMPDNVHLGVSVTDAGDRRRIRELDKKIAAVKFISFEPLLGNTLLSNITVEFSGMSWIIIGKLTGHGKKYDPFPYQIRTIVSRARLYGIPVFLKDNLKDIWPGPLIQEFPEV